MKRLFILLFCILSFNVVFSQNDVEESTGELEIREKIDDAFYLYLNEQYAKALPIFKELVRNDINNANFNYLTGMCYLKLPFENGRSIPYLERAVKNLTRNYVDGSYKETKAPIDALFWLGQAYHLNRGYTPAQIYYNKYRDTLPVTDIYNIEMAERQIESCKSAKELASHPVPVEISNLGNYINSKYKDFNPCLNGSGTSIVYTRVKPKNANDTNNLNIYSKIELQILESHCDNTGRWSKPKDITKELGSKGNFKTLSLSADGTELLLFRDDLENGTVTGYRAASIYYAKKNDSVWSTAKILNSNINSTYWESNATISPSGKEIYFTSDRPGGLGGLDIYVSRLRNGVWGSAINLGPTVNTKYDEETPVILPDGKTLFFSSEGHYNMGGFDIFYTKMIDTTKWTEPINIGYPINSTDDNLFFVPIGDGTKAYYSVARNEGYFTFGEEDIYELEFMYDQNKFPEIQLSGKLILEDMNQLDSSSNISAVDTISKKIVKSVMPDLTTGKYEMTMKPGEYEIKFKANNYREVTKYISLPKALRPTPVHMDGNLIPESIKQNKYFEIRNIYFGVNLTDLDREAMIAIEKLYSTMNENPGLYVEILGHTDSQGSDEYNDKLSINRSRAVIDYLIKKGIDPMRFVSKGEGKTHLVANDLTDKGKIIADAAKFNRRVEVRVLRSDNDQIVTVDELIPENLRFKEYNRFSVIIEENEDYVKFSEYDKLKPILKTISAQPTKTGFVYYGGDFKKQADANKALTEIIALGYDKAKVVDYFFLNKLNKFVVTNTVDWPRKFTIQLKACDSHIIMDAKFIEGVKEVKTKDGYYRYTYKEFTDLNIANEELKKLVERGFADAFIIEVSKLK